MAGYIGSKASVVSSGAERKTVITATSGQTSLTGLSYTPNQVHVFQNGVRLVDGTDYTATNGSSITLTVGASTDDQIVVISYATFETSDTVSASNGGTFNGDVSFGDDVKVKFGASNDLQIFHDGSNSFIQEGGTGQLVIRSEDLRLQDASGTNWLQADTDGAVRLYHNNSRKLATTSTGLDVTGDVTVTTSGSGDALTITSTDAGDTFAPDINFYRNSSSPADNDGLGLINFRGRNDNSQDVNYVQIQTTCPDVSDGSENGFFSINTMVDGSLGDRIVIDANGQVGIGTGSLTRELTVKKNDQCDVSIVAATNQSAQLLFGDTDADNRGIIQYDNGSDFMAFTVAGSEKLRIDSGGALNGPPSANFDIKTGSGTGDMRFFTNSTQKFHIEPSGRQSNLADVSGHLAKFENQHSSSPDILWLRMSNDAPDNNSQYFVYCSDSSTLRCAIWSDGDIDNHDNSYGGTSDQKLKQQITDASSQWDDIKALQVRKFKFNSDVEAGDSDEHWRLGVIAQEVEASGMSGLVNDRVDKDEDGNALETTTKSVKYSVLYMKAVKALQEAMDRIETLETKVAALEAGE